MDAFVKSLKSIQKEGTKTNTSLKSLSKDVTEIRSELDMLKDLKHSLEFIQSKVTEFDNSVTDHTEKKMERLNIELIRMKRIIIN